MLLMPMGFCIIIYGKTGIKVINIHSAHKTVHVLNSSDSDFVSVTYRTHINDQYVE